MTQVAPNRKSRHRRGWLQALVVILVLIGGWSALWALAANRAGAALDDWMQAEAGAGRQWTCPDRRVDGYPFAVRLDCSKPAYHGEVAGRIVSGTVEGLSAGIGLDHPTTVAVALRSPLVLRADTDEFRLFVSWEDMRLTAAGLPEAPRRGTVEATRLGVTLSTPRDGDLNARAARLTAQAEPATHGDAGPGAAQFAFTASGVTLPTLDDFAGGDEPVQADGQGVLARADLLSAPTVSRLEAWRAADGQLDLEKLTLAKGAFSGQANGTLALDDAHRMAGRLDTALTGFGPLAERFGIPLAGVKLGGLLTSLLGGKAAPAPESGDVVRLPVTFADGRLSVGPFKTPVRLDPLY